MANYRRRRRTRRRRRRRRGGKRGKSLGRSYRRSIRRSKCRGMERRTCMGTQGCRWNYRGKNKYCRKSTNRRHRRRTLRPRR